jgi:hypothetical protein
VTTTAQRCDEALERVVAAREVLQDHPTTLAEWRLEAAIREAERIARADAWRTVDSIVDALRGAHWAQEVNDVGEAESLAEWAELYRGEEVWLGEGGADGFRVSDDGTAITVWSAVVPVDRDEPDWVTETIQISELAGWVAPEQPEPTEWDLALTGQLGVSELVALAQSGSRDGVLAAVCAPNATPAVLRAAGAVLDVDIRYQEIVIKTPYRWVTAAWIDESLPAVDLASRIAEVIDCAEVTVTHAVLGADGTVTLTVDDAAVRDLGSVDVTGDDDCEMFDSATNLLRDHGLLASGYWPEWISTGTCYVALLGVDVSF